MAEPDELPQADQLDGAAHPRDTTPVIGQDAAIQKFLSSLSGGRMHHGWMITGPKGIGKATLAYHIARHLLGGDGSVDLIQSADDPLFRTVSAQSEPRLGVVRRTYDHERKKLRAQIRVEDIRALKSFFGLSAADGGWRVAIIDAADEMNGNAANALLKLLEEPPQRCMILLIAHQPGRILPTIRSRTQVLNCAPLSPNDLKTALATQGFDGDSDALHALSDGSVGDAITLSGSGGMETYQSILALLNNATSMDRGRILALGEAAANRSAPFAFGTILSLTERALVRIAKAGADALTTPLDAEKPIHQQFSQTARQARVWADLAHDVRSRAATAHAVNLDPAHIILDTFLSIETAAQTL